MCVAVVVAVGGKLGRTETQDQEISREFGIVDGTMQRTAAAVFDSRARTEGQSTSSVTCHLCCLLLTSLRSVAGEISASKVSK